VLPGPLYAPDCVAWGTGLTQQTKNTELMFFMATYDIYGNALSQGGAIFLVQITDRFNDFIVEGQVNDFGNGTYAVTYSVPADGHYRLRVTTDNGVNIRGSPWFFSIDTESLSEMEKNLIIAGGVIGGVVFFALGVVLVILYRRRRRHYTTIGRAVPRQGEI
jgi:hypothetical protein